jgi:hypothetical protein
MARRGGKPSRPGGAIHRSQPFVIASAAFFDSIFPHRRNLAAIAAFTVHGRNDIDGTRPS